MNLDNTVILSRYYLIRIFSIDNFHNNNSCSNEGGEIFAYKSPIIHVIVLKSIHNLFVIK
jgi:hypothetical protein